MQGPQSILSPTMLSSTTHGSDAGPCQLADMAQA